MSGVEWLVFVVIVLAWEYHDHVVRVLRARLSDAEQPAATTEEPTEP